MVDNEFWNGLYNSYGMNGKYSALNNYGLSSFFGSWFI